MRQRQRRETRGIRPRAAVARANSTTTYRALMPGAKYCYVQLILRLQVQIISEVVRKMKLPQRQTMSPRRVSGQCALKIHRFPQLKAEVENLRYAWALLRLVFRIEGRDKLYLWGMLVLCQQQHAL